MRALALGAVPTMSQSPDMATQTMEYRWEKQSFYGNGTTETDKTTGTNNQHVQSVLVVPVVPLSVKHNMSPDRGVRSHLCSADQGIDLLFSTMLFAE